MTSERELQSLRIAELMNEKEMSYRKLSDITGIAKSSLQRYVTNIESKIPSENSKALAKAFDVSLYYILGKDVPKKLDYSFILQFVCDEDKEIVRYALENGLTKDESEIFDGKEKSVKVLLNSFGYDLNFKDNNYFLVGDNGFSMINKQEVELLVSSTVDYLEFNAKKLLNEKLKIDNQS